MYPTTKAGGFYRFPQTPNTMINFSIAPCKSYFQELACPNSPTTDANLIVILDLLIHRREETHKSLVEEGRKISEISAKNVLWNGIGYILSQLSLNLKSYLVVHDVSNRHSFINVRIGIADKAPIFVQNVYRSPFTSPSSLQDFSGVTNEIF